MDSESISGALALHARCWGGAVTRPRVLLSGAQSKGRAEDGELGMWGEEARWEAGCWGRLGGGSAQEASLRGKSEQRPTEVREQAAQAPRKTVPAERPPACCPRSSPQPLLLEPTAVAKGHGELPVLTCALGLLAQPSSGGVLRLNRGELDAVHMPSFMALPLAEHGVL